MSQKPQIRRLNTGNIEKVKPKDRKWLLFPETSFLELPTLSVKNPNILLLFVLISSPIWIPIVVISWVPVALLYLMSWVIIDKKNYTLERVNWNNADKYLTPANDENCPGLPESLHGTWLMAGNPLADSLVTLANGRFRPDGTFSMKVYGPGCWTWHGNPFGRMLYAWVLAHSLVYDLRFDFQRKYARVFPIITIPGTNITLSIPSFIAFFGLRHHSPGLWIRETWFFGIRVMDYRFIRIVDGQGNRLEAFDELYQTRLDRWALIAKSRG